MSLDFGSEEIRELLVGYVLGPLTIMHRIGTPHRDITPANVYIGNRCALKLGDFGVAKTALKFMRENTSPFWKHGLAEQKRRINPLSGLVEHYTVMESTEKRYVFAAKVCCGFAAELGAMQINQEIKAYESTGVDAMRYYLLREVPLGNDGDFTFQRYSTDDRSQEGEFDRPIIGQQRGRCDHPPAP